MSAHLKIQNIIDHLTNAHAELKLAYNAAHEYDEDVTPEQRALFDQDAEFIEEMQEALSEFIDDLRHDQQEE
jgi:hypothetical protein